MVAGKDHRAGRRDVLVPARPGPEHGVRERTDDEGLQEPVEHATSRRRAKVYRAGAVDSPRACKRARSAAPTTPASLTSSATENVGSGWNPRAGRCERNPSRIGS